MFTRQTRVQKSYKIIFFGRKQCRKDRTWLCWIIEGRIWHGNSVRVIWLQQNLLTEGSTCEYHNKDHNTERNQGMEKMGFHSKFSDESDQNAATTFEYMKFSFSGCTRITCS